MFGWLWKLMPFSDTGDDLSKEKKEKKEKMAFFKYLENEMQQHNLGRDEILTKFISMQTNTKELACLDVDFALSIFQSSAFQTPTLRSFLSAGDMLDIYAFYISNPKFIAALQSKTIPNLADIALRHLNLNKQKSKEEFELSMTIFADHVKQVLDFKEYIHQKPTRHSQHIDWRLEPAPETIFKTKPCKQRV